jgi:hypothetical protein
MTYMTGDDYERTMKNVRQKRWIDVFDDLASIGDIWGHPSFTNWGGSYNSDEFDLVPKKKHFERRLKEKEQQLANVESIKKHYEDQITTLKIEIEQIKGKIVDK